MTIHRFWPRTVLALLALAGCGWFIADRAGWLEIPASSPGEARLDDRRYAEVAPLANHELGLARERLGVVGLSAAISVDGRVIWAGAKGWADLETRRALTTATMFRVGSTSKAITATLLARSVDAGVIALDAPISRYMAALPNREWAPLTPRQLASHTAGLPDYDGNRDWWGLYQSIALQRHFDDVVEALAIFDGSALESRPGTKFRYTSFDVNLLGAVLQSAGGAGFLELLKRDVLEPLRMASTGADHVFADTARIATFYDSRAGRAKRWRDVDLSQKWPSGGLLATSSDLARLCGGWFDPGFLEPETVKQFWTPQKLEDGSDNEQGYAIGWRAQPESRALGPDRATARYHHGGVSKGAMSWLVCYPEAKLGVALNINSLLDDFNRLAAAEPPITRLFFDLARLAPADR